MAANQDFYQILGVSRDADADSIKKAYRKLAMQFHPDRNPGDSAAEDKFKEAASAYDVLSNPEKKAKYDRFGHDAYTQSSRGGGGGGGFADAEDIFSSFGDIFGDFFGGGGGQQRSRRSGPRRGADLRYMSEITLKDVILGTEKEIEFEIDGECESCKGSGAEKGTSAKTCGSCGGQGQIFRSQGFFSVGQTCPTCAGRGQVIEKPCKPCKGRGRVKQARKIKLSIPAGVDTGTRLRVSNEGEGGYLGGPNGDLYVEVSVKDDEHFDREGSDLFTEVKVDYLQLLLGAEVEIETVTETHNLEIPRGTQVGDQIKVSGQGVPSLRGSRRGDLYCRIGVEIPKKLNKDEEKLLRDLAKLRDVEVVDHSSPLSGFFQRKKD